jgi:hypothetical protein
MAITSAVGTAFYIASTYSAAKSMTAITNANPGVATLAAAHGVVVGDILEVTSGWDRLNGRLVRVSAVATNDVTFESIDTSSTTNYPAGTGTGTIRIISAWTQITQITADFSVSGGGQQYADVTTLSDRTQKRIPTVRDPVDIVLPLFDDPALSWFATVNTVSEGSTTAGLRVVFPNASRLLANGYWSLRKTPTVSDSTLRGEIAISLAAEPTRYAT